MRQYEYDLAGGCTITVTTEEAPSGQGEGIEWKIEADGPVPIAEVAHRLADGVDEFCNLALAACTRLPSGNLRPGMGTYCLLQVWNPVYALALVLMRAVHSANVVKYDRYRGPSWGEFSPWPRGRDMEMEEVFAAADTNPSVQRERLRVMNLKDDQRPPCDIPSTPAGHRLVAVIDTLCFMRSPLEDGVLPVGRTERLQAVGRELRSLFVSAAAAPPSLSKNEEGIWEALAGKQMTAAMLAKHMGITTEDAVRACVSHIREKLNNKDAIRSLRGVGYFRPDAPPPGPARRL